jgi:hypothetical protein
LRHLSIQKAGITALIIPKLAEMDLSSPKQMKNIAGVQIQKPTKALLLMGYAKQCPIDVCIVVVKLQK